MSTQQQRQEWRELAERLSYFGLEGRAQSAITALLADVDALTQERDSLRRTLSIAADELRSTIAERDALAAELERVRAENDRLGARELAWAAYEDYYVHELTEGYAPETFNEWYVSDKA